MEGFYIQEVFGVMGESGNISLKVSIILPTYNRAKLLNRCVSSILLQTYSNWELIISDDGSSDETQEEVKKLQLLDNRIIYHKNDQNLGLPKNRNEALLLVSGNLIFFIEDDLILEPNCLEILVETWEKIKQRNIKVGAICPALILEASYSGAHRTILDFARKLKEKELERNPCIIDKKTGLIYRNFSPTFKDIFEVEDCHACSMYPKYIFKEIRYEERVYRGNYIGEESEVHQKLRKKGYKLYFQPRAIVYHKTVNSGGCRISLYKWSYYFIRNHIIFVKRNFGIKSLYMIPCFLTYIFIVFIRYALSYSLKMTKRR